MKAKIEWYKEVLELEPSSKVFFPLARLLVEDNQLDEALRLLRTGLALHPDFFEARLLLIDVLHACGDIKARDAEAEFFTTLFASYPRFWEAWESSLSSDNYRHDVALAMRFVAASNQQKGLSLSSVFAKGLQALEQEKGASFAQTTEQQPPSNMIFPVEPHDEQKTSANKGLQCSNNCGDTPRSPLVKNEKGLLNERAPHLVTPDEHTANQAHLLDINQRTPHEQQEEHLLVHHQKETPLLTSSLHDALDSKSPVTGSLEEVQYLEVQDNSLISTIEFEHGNQEELFSLRTRSMAEVLAGQGDIQGALEIYLELLADTESADMQNLLTSRINSLRQGMPTEGTTVEPPSPVPAQQKEKLINLLSALAERLEIRAQTSRIAQ